jgi:hypothetical protein
VIKVKLTIIDRRIIEIMYAGMIPSRAEINRSEDPTNNDPKAADDTRATFDALRNTLSSDSKLLAENLYSSSAMSRLSKQYVGKCCLQPCV